VAGEEQTGRVRVARPDRLDYTAGDAEADQEQRTDGEREHHHQAALRRVGQDVGVRAAQADVEQQHGGGDAERPRRIEPEHALEHHEPGDELPRS